MWNIPGESHRYLIEPLGGTHAKNMLYVRFTKFIQSIILGNKTAPRYMLQLIKNNTKTITGRNIRKISLENNNCDIFNINIKIIIGL